MSATVADVFKQIEFDITSNMSQDMPETLDAKVVQTELEADAYEQFRAAAEAEGLTIKAAARRAIEAFAARHHPIEEDDPLFEPLDRDPGDGDDDASEHVDDIVYGTETQR
jgi:hypothetical protein